ncbi:MAG TPA: polysaccharide deacetylase family protein [Ohtaekwangia sp.]|nr:polysaccharide deacetylase family protein [Ohtaekwangia sp.]
MRKSLAVVFMMLFPVWLHAQPTLSFTFDDGSTDDMPGYAFEEWNTMLLDHLDSAGVNAVFFVTGKNKMDSRGKYLLQSWNDRGHRIANHTFSHPSYNNPNTTFEKFGEEFLQTDSIINAYDNYIKLFRFPYLKEGNSREKIEQFRAFMKSHGYKNGSVTIDASDWYVSSRLVKRLKEDPDADIEGFRKYYLEHLYGKAVYYEALAFKLTGRHIKHTLLLHHNLAAALFLGDLTKFFKEKGWRIIDATAAFGDDIFQEQPGNVPAGESLIWALCSESEKCKALLRYPAEDSQYEKEAMDKRGL